MIRLALCNEVLAGEFDFADQCRITALLGYDAIEIAPFTLSDEPARLTQAQRRTYRHMAEDAGLEIAGLHWLMNVPLGMSITDPVRADNAADHMEAMVALCADLGGAVLVHGSPDQRNPADAPDPQQARDTAAKCFAKAGQAAHEAGLIYCLEPLAPELTPFLNTIAECVALIDEINSPGLWTMLDTCAASGGEERSSAELLQTWLPTGRIGHIHVNDPNKGAPGQGEMRFGPVMAAVAASTYQGYVSCEPFVYEPSGLGAAAVAAGYLRGLREGVEGGL